MSGPVAGYSPLFWLRNDSVPIFGGSSSLGGPSPHAIQDPQISQWGDKSGNGNNDAPYSGLSCGGMYYSIARNLVYGQGLRNYTTLVLPSGVSATAFTSPGFSVGGVVTLRSLQGYHASPLNWATILSLGPSTKTGTAPYPLLVLCLDPAGSGNLAVVIFIQTGASQWQVITCVSSLAPSSNKFFFQLSNCTGSSFDLWLNGQHETLSISDPNGYVAEALNATFSGAEFSPYVLWGSPYTSFSATPSTFEVALHELWLAGTATPTVGSPDTGLGGAALGLCRIVASDNRLFSYA